MKYAVFEHGGKQFVASEGQVMEIDRLAQQAGSAVEFSQVLLVRADDHVQIGSPYVRGARVKARIASHVKGPKLVVFKYRPKQRYRVRHGHRQGLTRIEIETIGVPGGGAESTAASKTSPKEPKAETPARKTAAKPKPQRAATARKKAEAGAKPAAKTKAKAQAPGRKTAQKSKPVKKPAAKKKPAGSKE